MSIKLLLLKSGETLVSEAKELISEEKVCGYLLENPHLVDVRKTLLLVEESEESNETSGDLEVVLAPWIILTSDTQIPVPPDWIVTIVEPIKTIKEMYEEKVNGQDNQVSTLEG
jgi:hypothetical protein